MDNRPVDSFVRSIRYVLDDFQDICTGNMLLFLIDLLFYVPVISYGHVETLPPFYETSTRQWVYPAKFFFFVIIRFCLFV